MGGEPARFGSISSLLEALARASDGGEAEANPELLPGQKAGRFEVLREIGRGGFGVVYEAFDPELRRKVALKVLRSSRSARAPAPDWLRREAEATARIDHPGVVTIYDAGLTGRVPWLAMELLKGETLADRLQRGPLPIADAVQVGLYVASALGHSHALGVVHRDLKPANVFLTEDGRVKILDLGMAHFLGAAGVGGGGTPAYMAPEQARGEPCDARADVFALGAVLYEALSGQPAFAVRNGSSIVLDGDAPPALPPGVPPQLRRLVGRFLSFDPAARSDDGRAAAEELLPIRLRLDRPRRSRRLLLLAGLGAVAAAAGVAIGWLLGPAARPERTRVAIADASNRSGDADLDGLSGLIAISLQQSRRLEVLPRSHLLDLMGQVDAEAGPLDERLARRVARLAGIRVLLLPGVRTAGKAYVLELQAVDPVGERKLFAVEARGAPKASLPGLVDEVSEKARRALDERASEISAAAVRVAEAVSPSLEAHRHYFAGMDCVDRPTRAGNWRTPSGDCAAELRRAVEIDPGFALAHYQLALATYVPHGQTEVSRAAIEAALRHVDRAPPREQLFIRALAAEVSGRPAEARDLYGQALRDHAVEKRVLFRAADFHYHDEAYDRAVPLFEEVLRLDPAFEWALDHLPRALGSLGRREALERRVREWSAMAPSVPVLHALATAHLWLGDPARAVDVARQEVDAGGGDAAADDLAGALAAAGDLAGAEAILRRLAGSGPALRLVTVLATAGRLLEAREAVGAFVRRFPENLASRLHLEAALAAAAGDVDALWQAAARLSAGGRRDDSASLATALAYLGDEEHAAELASHLAPGGADEATYLAVAEWRRGDVAAAKARLRALEERNPLPGGQIPPAFLRAEVAASAGQDGEAVEALHRLGELPQLGIWKPFVYPRAQILLARSLLRLGKPAEALRAVQSLLDTCKRADPGLMPLREARELRAELAQSEGARSGD